MVRTNNPDLPQSTWSLDRLKTWLRASWRKLATDAWWIGKALSYAEKQLKEEGKWMEFCRDACPGLSYETIRRYIRLAKAVKDPDDLDGMELNKAYQLACIVQLKEQPEKPHAPPDNPAATTPGGPPDSPPGNDVSGGTEPGEPDDGAARPGDEPEFRERVQHHPGLTLSFFCRKVCEQLTSLERLPRKERWADLDVETIRTQLLELQEQVAKALKELPKSRRKAS